LHGRREERDQLINLWLAALLVTLTWGAVAFGSPYPWAYRPLLLASTILGACGWWLGRKHPAPSPLLVAGLTVIGVTIALQLIPLPEAIVDTLSPRAREVLREQSLSFRVTPPATFPLSIAPSRTQLGLAFFAAFAVLMLGTGRALTRKAASRLAAAIAVLGATLATIGIVQRATFTGKIYGFWELVQGGTPFGPFVNRNHFAGWMLMAIPVVLGYFLAQISTSEGPRSPGLRNRILWLSTARGNRAVLAAFAAVVMALSLVLTLSRSGMAGLMLAFAVTLFFVARREDRLANRGVVLAYLVLTTLTIFLWAGLDQVALRFAQLDVTAFNQRPAIWADTVRIVRDFWFTGTGFNTYGVSTLHYQTAVPGEHLREAHSDYLQLAAEGGLLMAIPILATVVIFIGVVGRRLRDDVGSIRWIRMGAITGLIAIAFQSLVEFSLQMPGNAALCAVIAGLAIHDGQRV
jgi:hypothetical protein